MEDNEEVPEPDPPSTTKGPWLPQGQETDLDDDSPSDAHLPVPFSFNRPPPGGVLFPGIGRHEQLSYSSPFPANHPCPSPSHLHLHLHHHPHVPAIASTSSGIHSQDLLSSEPVSSEFPPQMPPRKRVSTRDLGRRADVAAAAAGSAVAPGHQHPAEQVPDPEASIASLAGAFKTSFSSRFQEAQMPQSPSPAAGPSQSAPSTSKKSKRKGKAKEATPTPTVLGQTSGNRAGNPILVSDEDGENPVGIKSATEAAAGDAASSVREGSSVVSITGDSRRPSGPMSQAQFAYLQGKYNEEARELKAGKGKQAVHESDSITALPRPVPAPGPLVPGPAPQEQAEEKSVAGALKTTPALPTDGWEMNEARLENLGRPDPTADLVVRAIFPYVMEGVLEYDPLELEDLPSRPPVIPAPSRSTLAAASKAATATGDSALPSSGLVDWDGEFNKLLGLPSDAEDSFEDYTESDYERMMAGEEPKKKKKKEKGKGKAIKVAEHEPMVTDNLLQEEDTTADSVYEDPMVIGTMEENANVLGKQQTDLESLSKSLPYPALDAEPYIYNPTDITQWLSDVSLEYPGNPEELTLEELGAEIDAYCDDIAGINSQPLRVGPLERNVVPPIIKEHQPTLSIFQEPQVEHSSTQKHQIVPSFAHNEQRGQTVLPEERNMDAEGDIELPDQIATSPLTSLSVMSTPSLFQEEDDQVNTQSFANEASGEQDTSIEKNQKAEILGEVINLISDDEKTPTVEKSYPLIEATTANLGNITTGSEVMVEVAIPSPVATSPPFVRPASVASVTPQPTARRRSNRRGTQASPGVSSTLRNTRSQASEQRNAETASLPGTSATRRRSARISGAGLPEQSPRNSSPPMSVTSEGRRSSRTNTSYIHRYHDTRQSQGRGEAEEAEDDEVDMI
ncbi:hypothetical protein TWF281_002425 [Arthrobotrys megalospora]